MTDSANHIGYTHSSLATARRCLTEYDLRYNLLLEPDSDENREALDVGTTWHNAHAALHTKGEAAAYEAIAAHAPSPLWAEKISRLFAAYRWYWRDSGFAVIESERVFEVEFNGKLFRGARDAILRTPDGRRGLHELKTTSDSVDAESSYWDRLRLDVQIGIYAHAEKDLPDFIVYDVVRKPTINPKSIISKDAIRLAGELKAKGSGTYFAEEIPGDDLTVALQAGRETTRMYGARLTADIGDRPENYFARREVPRSRDEIATLERNLLAQVDLLEYAKRNGLMHRNPDACNVFGRCIFFSLCSHNIRPVEGEPAPHGFRIREHAHVELVR
jgi:hypothetical protein